MVLLEEIEEEKEPTEAISPSSSSSSLPPSPPPAAEAQDELKQQAKTLLETADHDPIEIPNALYKILTEVIKPLFQASKHPQLTSTGRKNLIPKPPQVGRFGYDSIFDDSRPWKNKWTIDLLRTVLDRYNDIKRDDEDEEDSTQKQTVQAHFHLLIPPILNLIDEVEVAYKVAGCERLTQLCELLVRNKSDMMKKTGLADVFVDALQKTFTYLPTLTPEDESLSLMQAVYPAFHALVNARFVGVLGYLEHSRTRPDLTGDQHTSRNPPKVSKSPPPPPPPQYLTTPAQVSAELTSRQKLLTSLLRNSLLYGLNHLSTGAGHGLSTSVHISTFLLSQIPPLTAAMGIYIVSHLQSLLPLLGDILADPFSTTSPVMLLESAKAMAALVSTCWPRIRDRWLSHCVSSLVTCWLNITDDIEGGMKQNKPLEELSLVQRELRNVMELLELVIGPEEFNKAKANLLAGEPSLHDLFDYHGG